MNKNIYQIIAEEKLIEQLIDKYNVKTIYKDDLAQEIYLIILTKDESKLKEMYDNNQLNFYLARIISNQYFSKTSMFYKDYKKYNMNKNESTDNTLPEIADE